MAVTSPSRVSTAAAVSPRGPSRGAKLRAPGWYRAALFDVIGFAFAFGLTCLIRALMHQHPVVDGRAILPVALIAVPLFFLVGLGVADYWFYWASGRPTRPEDHSQHGAHTWRDYFRVNTDHKVIGTQYVVHSFFFLLVGGLLAMLIRAQLAKPGMQFLTPEQYNGVFSVHASILIFLFVIPVFAGLANFVLPLMIGAPDMAFPRLNALSFWLLPIGGIMMMMSFLAPGGAFAAGWTNYAPLSTTMPPGQLFFALAVQFAGASSIATALNFLVTIITMRAPGMSFFRLPLLVWANFATSLLVVIATPFIAASQFFVLLDTTLHFHFFDAFVGAGRNGNVIMYQHIFWFYSHPAVYIMILPGFGIISEVLAVKARKPIFGYRMMAFSLLAIVVLGFTVWAHHMFVSGMAPWIRIPMMITTAIIAIPTGIKVFSWIATLWRGVLHLDTPMLFALGFLTTFTLGGISGIMLAMIPFDIHVSQTYFIVAHIHYVLYGGSLFTIFAGVYYWFPKMTGRMFDDRLGKWHFWLTFISFNLTFGPMHIIGIQGMPRRVAEYAHQFAAWNLFISLMSFVLGASTLIFLYNIVVSWRGGPRASANPWRALTLEWQVSSPPPIFNFDTVPTVVGGPYEYGVPGAVHGIFKPPAEAKRGAARPVAAGSGPPRRGADGEGDHP
ncbi:MAG: cbb3-type cytochrome c oxidase subunit I [Solirubrobacterales bacterium]|nr:cbb3-type cytochrome c oxidase subunit I [Solirubrobacterales bacterium]